jgi:hypothetical protein
MTVQAVSDGGWESGGESLLWDVVGIFERDGERSERFDVSIA